MADNGEGAGVLAGASCSSKAGMAALRRAIHSLDKPMPHWTQTGIRQSTGVTHRLGRKTPKDESVHISKKKEHEMETKVLPEVCKHQVGLGPFQDGPAHLHGTTLDGLLVQNVPLASSFGAGRF